MKVLTHIGQFSDQYNYSDQARKLKEFLEDYDDERDDPKFYKGRELQRRLADRWTFSEIFLEMKHISFQGTRS